MNFIQLVQETARHVGLQGTGPASVDINTYETQIIKAVQDAWRIIQTYRTKWDWMRDNTNFLMTIGQEIYTPTDVLGLSPRLRSWLEDTFYIEEDGQRASLRYVHYDEYNYRYMNDEVSRRPYEFTIRPWDRALQFAKPDKAYTIICDYQKTPQELVAETDIPEFAEHFHILIVFKALELYGAAISFQEITSMYGVEAAKMWGSLMREHNPRTRLKVRGIA